MKPIKLEISAFGPFPNKIIIDFSTLNKQGLYLISGPTGAGKTSIFDAIVFALYGVASTDIRESKSFRSDFAKKEDKTYVTLEFKKDNNTYIITRNPLYIVEGRKTPIEQKASLIMPNKEVIETTKKVNQKITEIIGLTVEQFKQTVMLAQGEFMKIIFAESAKRDEIFRKLFGTNAYNNFILYLKEELSKKASDLKALKSVLVNLINFPTELMLPSINAATNDLSYVPSLLDEIENELSLKKKELEDLNKQSNILRTNLLKLEKEKENSITTNNNIDKLLNTKQQLIQLNSKKSQIELNKKLLIDLNYASKISSYYGDYKNKITNFDKLNKTNKLLLSKYMEIKNEFDFYNSEIQHINMDKEIKDKYEQQIIQIEKDLEKLNKISLIKEELTLIKKDLENLTKDIELNNKELETYKSNLQDDNILNEEKTSKLLLKQKLNNSIEDIKNQIKEYNNLKNDYDILLSSKNLQLKEHKYYEVALEKERIQLNKTNELETKYLNSIAPSLAKKLKDGIPCPVCGSLTHPNPCMSSEAHTSKEDVEYAKEELKKITREKDKSYKKLLELTTNINTQIDFFLKKLNIQDENNILNQLNSLNDYLNNELKNQNNKLKDTENKITKINDELEKNKSLKIQIEEKENHIKTFDEKTSKLNNQLNLKLGEKGSIEKEITINLTEEELLEALDYNKQSYELLSDSIYEFEQGLKDITDKFNQINGELKNSNQEIEAAKADLEHYKDIYTKELNKTTLANLPDEKLIELFNKTKDISIIVKEITSYEEKYKQTTSLYEELTSLVGSKEKTNIEEINNQIENITLNQNNLDSKTLELSNLIAVTTNNSDKLKQKFNEYLPLNNYYKNLLNITNTASGNNKYHLSFERYILIEYFEQVLEYANIRLLKMTNNRYSLLRKMTTDGKGQQGLDIEIFDYETGKTRNIKTLSGGETFKAALALSLGLSDAIESGAGGIEIDALFIDEGFGTLDDESLSQAINVLQELKNDNKTIAIISHVQELENIIESKIKVTKLASGSTVQIQ